MKIMGIKDNKDKLILLFDEMALDSSPFRPYGDIRPRSRTCAIRVFS
jgi:hypothetical protein